MQPLSANKRLMQFLDKADEELPELLPVCHATKLQDMEEILRKGSIIASKCPVFNENLSYYFYGKPSYVVSSDKTKANTSPWLFPSCFIFNINKVEISKIYPFDSGAFVQGKRYTDYIPETIPLEDFEMEPNTENIKKYVHLFYQSNENYIKGICSIDRKKLTNSVTQTLASLIQAPGLDTFDERAGTVEVVMNKDLILRDALVALIIPDEFTDDEYFVDFVKESPDVEIETYPVHYPTSPVRYNEALFTRVYDYLRKESLL